MKTLDFNKSFNSVKLAENIEQQFGVNVDLTKYTREQLEDIRNKLRTRVFQYEGNSKMNDLLTNEEYQKDKAMLELLNTRIKEMLGEQMKNLLGKLDQLNEGKKKDHTGDGKNDFDDVQVARMVAGGVPKKKAIAKATSDKFKEEKVEEKAVSKAQQQAAGIALAAKEKGKPVKKGTASAAMAKMPKKELKKFAKTKHKGLPDKKADEGVEETLLPKQQAVAKKILDKDMADAKADRAARRQAGTKAPANESFRKHVAIVNESLARMINEDEEGKAKAITAASDMVNDFTSWMQRVGTYQTKSMIELADSIRANFGAQEAETFKQAVGPALAATLETLTQQREAISNSVAVLAGEAAPEMPMGQEPMPEPGIDAAGPDELNPADELDAFAASDAASGAGTTGREVRESAEVKQARKISEQHSIIARLVK